MYELGQSVHSVPTYPAGPMCQATGQFRVPHCRQNANSPPIQSDRPNSQVEPTSKLSKSPKSKRSKGRFQRVSESAQRTLFLSHTAHQSHTVVHEQTGRRETLTVQPVLFAPLPSPLSRYICLCTGVASSRSLSADAVDSTSEADRSAALQRASASSAVRPFSAARLAICSRNASRSP